MKKYLFLLLANAAVLFIVLQMILPVSRPENALTYRFTFVSGTNQDAQAAGMAQADEKLGTNTRLTGMRTYSDQGQALLLAKADYAHVDGVITTGCAGPQSLVGDQISRCEEDGIPVVLIGEDIRGSNRTACIEIDWNSAGAMAWQLLFYTHWMEDR